MDSELNGKAGRRGEGRSARARDTWDDRLLELAGRITERDRTICRLLYEHRVLTTFQIEEVAFTSLRKTQERLSFLQGFEVVERFRPRSWLGTGPFHFTLGRAGAEVIAAEDGVPIAELDWRKRLNTSALATSIQLAHLVGCNGVFTSLTAAARDTAGASLEEWWSSRRCKAAWGEAIRPDGYGVYVEGNVRLPFLLEYDTGSETLARLKGKLPGYAALTKAVDHPTWVCFAFLSAAREASARRVLIHPEVPVATAVVSPDSAAGGPVWLAIGDVGARLRLVDLGHPSRALGQLAEGSDHGVR
ncbi:MAG: replication-relaxation family protein [Acidimicrobiales bacterium]|jgi:hypothetical protein